jgi:hypothetical protein
MYLDKIIVVAENKEIPLIPECDRDGTSDLPGYAGIYKLQNIHYYFHE